MSEIKVINAADVGKVSRLISQLNNNEESHIGYCGKGSEEIANSLTEDISDVKYTGSFVGAYENNQLIGVLGFDADLEDDSAEIWGPFIKEDKWEVVSGLWSEMNNLLPAEIHSLSMFPNIKNHNVLNLAKDLGFCEHSEQAILTFYRDDKNKLADVDMIELNQNYFSDMKELHDQEFPDTYYSGQQILDRINTQRKVFILNNHHGLSGYVYVEAEPEFGEGSIEFFAVKESERGKGVGKQLLTVALKWLFTFETIDFITLCVNSSNDNALRLYKKVGFRRIHDLCFFTKEI